MSDNGNSGERTVARQSGGLFALGNPGRPKGVRHQLTESFLKAAFKDFAEHGEQAFETVRENDPSTYLKVIAALLPKEVAGEGGGPIQVTIRRLSDLVEHEAVP